MNANTPQSSLPKDLAGYQNVRMGAVEPSDLLVAQHGGYFWATQLHAGRPILEDGTFNSEIVGDFTRVYRKIATPKQSLDNPQADAFFKVATNLDKVMDMAEPSKTVELSVCTEWPSGGVMSLSDLIQSGVPITDREALLRDYVEPVSKAATHDDGKPPLACLPLKALREVALVQLYGKIKYGDFFNYKKGMEVSRNASCAMRHIADFMDGQDLDSESGRSHLAHAACRILFILENLADGVAIDDRYAS